MKKEYTSYYDSVTGSTLVKYPYAHEFRQQHTVTLWSL